MFRPKKAEAFKIWLVQVVRGRIGEIDDPELGFDRLMETYLKKGYSKEWVNQRLKSIEVRKELTDEWDNRGVKKGQEYGIITDEIIKAWSWLLVKQYKNHKGLRDKESERIDNVLKTLLSLVFYTKILELAYFIGCNFKQKVGLLKHLKPFQILLATNWIWILFKLLFIKRILPTWKLLKPMILCGKEH